VEQTVDRAASLAPVRDAVVARGPSPRLVRHGAPAEFVFPLLPVHAARELVIGLARQWQCWSGAEAVVVALGFVRLGRTLVGRCCVNKLPQIVESALDRRQADASFPEFAAADARALAGEDQPVATLLFQTAADAVGGALLYSADPIDLPGELCQQFAAWSGRLVDQAALVEERSDDRRVFEAAKADALAEFAAGAGHEINNPLATIAGRVQILLRDEKDGNRRQNLATIGAQALRVRDMIGDLMLFARPPASLPRRLLLNDVAGSVVDRFAEAARSRSCRLALAAAGPVFATADPTQLQVVLSELIRNSLEAIDRRGTIAPGMVVPGTIDPGEIIPGEIVVGLERSTVSAKSCAVLSVTDNGPGLSDPDRAHLFDPFYSGRDAGRGLGFGLCKCWRIVTEHGGWIDVDSVPRVATAFRVYWPDEPARPLDEPSGPVSLSCSS
jgi:signal transduction histidine kinase